MRILTLRCLEPVRKSVHIGRGDYRSITIGYKEIPVVVDFNTFLQAYTVGMPMSVPGDDKSCNAIAIQLEFSKGDMYSVRSVTFSEFERVFGFPFPTNKDEPNLVLKADGYEEE